MNRTNKIISIAILALGLGFMPQAQGMGYFKTAYNSACSWGKKAVNSALVVKSQAMARIAMIANHIAPTKKSDQSPEITQNHNALKRAQMIVNHLAPVVSEQTVLVNKTHGKDELKPYAFENQIQAMLMWFYNDANNSGLDLIGPEIGFEEIFDTNNNKIGTIYFHKKDTTDATPLITRFVNNENILIGFSIASVDSKTKAGAISYLHINQNERRGGLGKTLLAYVTRKLYELGCTSFHGTANSFDLPAHENTSEMQTKLEGFYGQFGAESLDGNKARLGVTIQ